MFSDSKSELLGLIGFRTLRGSCANLLSERVSDARGGLDHCLLCKVSLLFSAEYAKVSVLCSVRDMQSVRVI